MTQQTTDLHPDTTNPETLVDRLRGIYRIPIRDGLGPVGAGDEPDNPAEYVRSGFQTPPIQRAAAAEIERLRAALRKHGGHVSGCGWNGGRTCDCGWEEVASDVR